MIVDSEVMMKLEDILFCYERVTSLVEISQAVIGENIAGVTGLPENSLNYALFEIAERLSTVNKDLKSIILNSRIATPGENKNLCQSGHSDKGQ